MHRTLGLVAVGVGLFLLCAANLTAAQWINPPCANGRDGTISYGVTSDATGHGFSGSPYSNLQCFSNRITAVTGIRSFSYSIGLETGGPLFNYTARVIQETTQQTVAIVYMGLSPESGGVMTATFPLPVVALDPNQVYWLAFCSDKLTYNTAAYAVNAYYGYKAMWYCYTGSCTSPGGGTWTQTSASTFTTTIEYNCIPPSPTPSPTVTPTQTPSPTPSVSATPSQTPSNSPTTSPTPSVTPSPSSTPSPSPTPSSTPTPTTSPSSTPSATPSKSQTPSATPSPSQTPSGSPSPSQSPSSSPSPSSSNSPSPSPSPSSLPVTSPITQNVTIGFDESAPSLNISLPAPSDAPQQSQAAAIGFAQAQAGNSTLTIAPQGYTVNNTQSELNGIQITTFSYSTTFTDPASGSSCDMTQTFSSSTGPRTESFAGSTFSIDEGSVKWSIDLTTSSGFAGGLSVSYLVSQLASSSSSSSSNGTVVKGESAANVTTYFLTSDSSLGGERQQTLVKLDVFDVAWVDGASFEPVGHSVVSRSNGTSTSFILMLDLPPFTTSLEYDPVVGLASLDQPGGGGGGGGDDTDVGLIVGLVVGLTVGLALLVIVLVLVAAAVVLVVRRRKARPSFSYDDAL